MTERGVTATTANRGVSLEPIALTREHGGVVRVVDGPVGIDIRFNPSANPLNAACRARTATRVAVARDREYDLLHPALGLHVATAAAVNLERLAAWFRAIPRAATHNLALRRARRLSRLRQRHPPFLRKRLGEKTTR